MAEQARSHSSTAESLALTSGAIGAFAGAVVGIALGGETLGLWGERSIGTAAILVAALAGGAAFAVSFVRANHVNGWLVAARWRRIAQTASLTLAAAGVAIVLTASVFALFQSAFRDLQLDPIARVVVLGVTGAVAAYALSVLAAGITSGRLAALVGLFMVAGVFASMLTADDPGWWRYHFSALGTGDAASASVFNITLLIAGIVLVTLADYLTADLHSRHWVFAGRGGGASLIRWLISAVGVLLFGVGLVPFDVGPVLHNVLAYGLLAGFGILIVAVPLVIVGLPRSFTSVTTGALVTLAVLFVLYIPIGYLNLTALELLAMVLIFAWVMLFARTIGARESGSAEAPARPEPVQRVAPEHHPSEGAERAERLQERLYLIVTSLGVTVAVGGHGDPPALEVLLVVTVTALASLLAILLAHLIAHVTIYQRMLTRDEFVHAIQATLGAIVVLIPPAFFLGASALGWWSVGGAVAASAVAMLGALVAVGVIALHRIRLPWWQRALALGGEVALGGVVIALELFLHV